MTSPSDSRTSKELAQRIDDCLHCLWIDGVAEVKARCLLREAMEALRAAPEPEAIRQYAPSTKEDEGEFLAGQRRCAATAQRVELTRVDFLRLLSLAERGA